MSELAKKLGSTATWRKDKYGNYVDCNEFYAEVAGLDSPHSIVGKNDYDMPWRDLADLFLAGDQLVMNGVGNERLLVHEKEYSVDGVLDIAVCENQDKNQRGDVIGVYGTFMNITGHVIAEKATGYYDEKKKRLYLPDDFGEGAYLTLTEARVLEKVGVGWTAGEVALFLGSKEKTVRVHLDSLKKKLGASTKNDLTVICQEFGLHFTLLEVLNNLDPVVVGK